MLSFKINKKSTSAQLPTPVTKSTVNLSKRAFNDDDNDEEEKPDFIEGLDGTNIVSKNPKKAEKKGLIIPLIPNTIGWAAKLKALEAASLSVPSVLLEVDAEPKDTSSEILDNTAPPPPKEEGEPNNVENGETQTLEQLAVKELMEEATSTKSEKKSNYTIASTFQNRLQDDGDEEEEKMDASESALEDYERVPIEDFGLAMLRGMGWKESEGVGLKNKKVVVMEEPKLRPKGLGLGAEPARPQGNAGPQTGDKKEDLSVKVGNYALITRGGKKACYGQIVACDHDVNRVVVKLARGGELETISQSYIEVVTAAEYKKNSKVLNIDKYKEYSDKVPENSSRNRHQDERRKNEESRSSGSSEDEKKYNNSRKERRDESDRDRGRDGKHGSRRQGREYERDNDNDRDRERDRKGRSTKDYKEDTRDYERDREHKQSRSRERRRHDKEKDQRDSNSSKRKDRKDRDHSDRDRRRRRHSSSDSR